MTLQSIVTGAPLASHLTFSLPTFSSSTAVPVSFRLVETWWRIASAALCYLLSSTWGILEALAQHSCTNLLGTPTSAASLMGSFSRPAKHSTKARRHQWINSKVYSIWLLRRFWGQDWARPPPHSQWCSLLALPILPSYSLGLLLKSINYRQTQLTQALLSGGTLAETHAEAHSTWALPLWCPLSDFPVSAPVMSLAWGSSPPLPLLPLCNTTKATQPPPKCYILLWPSFLKRKSILNIHWKDWWGSWSSNTWATQRWERL